MEKIVWLAVVALACGGCGGDDTDSLDGMVFESEALVEMGLGPNGPVKGRARLSFDGGQYAWRHSDLDCHGPYRLSGAELTAETEIPCASYGTIRARWDAAAGVITWASDARYLRK